MQDERRVTTLAAAGGWFRYNLKQRSYRRYRNNPPLQRSWLAGNLRTV